MFAVTVVFLRKARGFGSGECDSGLQYLEVHVQSLVSGKPSDIPRIMFSTLLVLYTMFANTDMEIVGC